MIRRILISFVVPKWKLQYRALSYVADSISKVTRLPQHRFEIIHIYINAHIYIKYLCRPLISFEPWSAAHLDNTGGA